MAVSRFGEWLKAERVKRGWSQEKLGAEVGLTKAQISRIETGKQGTRKDTAVRIAHGIGASPQSALNALIADTDGVVPAGFRKVKVGEYGGQPLEVVVRDTITDDELRRIKMAVHIALSDPDAE